MVGPVPDADRRRTLQWIRVGLTVLVGTSAGLTTTQGDASTGVVVGAVATGLVVGAGLSWWLVPDAESVSPASNRRHRR